MGLSVLGATGLRPRALLDPEPGLPPWMARGELPIQRMLPSPGMLSGAPGIAKAAAAPGT